MSIGSRSREVSFDSRQETVYVRNGRIRIVERASLCIQTGLIVGSAEKRFEPSIQLALSICDKDKLPYVNLSSEEQDVIRYLKGETLKDVTVLNEGMLNPTENYVLVCVYGFALGWGKYMQNGMLKNKYYAGWRMQ